MHKLERISVCSSLDLQILLGRERRSMQSQGDSSIQDVPAQAVQLYRAAISTHIEALKLRQCSQTHQDFLCSPTRNISACEDCISVDVFPIFQLQTQLWCQNLSPSPTDSVLICRYLFIGIIVVTMMTLMTVCSSCLYSNKLS